MFRASTVDVTLTSCNCFCRHDHSRCGRRQQESHCYLFRTISVTTPPVIDRSRFFCVRCFFLIYSSAIEGAAAAAALRWRSLVSVAWFIATQLAVTENYGSSGSIETLEENGDETIGTTPQTILTTITVCHGGQRRNGEWQWPLRYRSYIECGADAKQLTLVIGRVIPNVRRSLCHSSQMSYGHLPDVSVFL